MRSRGTASQSRICLLDSHWQAIRHAEIRADAGRTVGAEESRAEVQTLRHTSDAVLTGIGTILADDPLLTDRSGLPRRRRLQRVILDSRLRLAPKSRIVKSADKDLLVFTAAPLQSTKARKLRDAGVEIVRV